MNKICKVVSIALSTSLFSTMLTPTVAYADDTIDSATELISATIELAATGVESATYDTALETVLNNISVNGEEVSYEGTVIGYYNTSTPTTLYGDAEKTSPVISQKAEGFIVEPSLLRTLVSDFNEGLVDTYSPTDLTDWSKIIGKYDVTLGKGGSNEVTIPADNWINCGTSEFNFSKHYNLYGPDLSNTSLVIGSYAIMPDNALYMSTEVLVMCMKDDGDIHYKRSGASGKQDDIGSTSWSTWPIIKVSTYINPNFSCGVVEPQVTLYAASGTACTNNPDIDAYVKPVLSSDATVTAPSNLSTCYSEGIATVGVYWYTADYGTYPKTGDWFIPSKQEVTKTTVGNATLNARLAKLNGLTMADELTVTHAAWFVGETNIDDFLGETSVMEAGGQADIDTPTEIDSMSFNVIVPSSLPIKVDNLGEVYVADNAVISNYSCAAVTIKSVTITPKPDTGWTMVTENPSKKRDAKEFTFSTSLTDGIDIGIDENLSFTYTAELSPLTEGTDSLDLVTVSVVVDWAEEGTT